MELWIPITLFAAFMQNLRSATQKHLKARLSDTGASLARFLFAAPLAGLYVAALALRPEPAVPAPHLAFIALCVAGGVAQILATVMLVRLFGYRNFTVGTTFSKTESLQAAAFGFVFLGETVTAGATLAILVSVAGVVLISLPARALRAAGSAPRAQPDASILLGLGAGALFGLSAVAFRAASLSLAEGDVWVRAAVTLLCVTVLQTLMMTAWMRIREPGEIGRVFAAWRVAGLVGVTGVLGSIGWFTAMTLQNAAYVRALGQVELVFAFAASWLLFRERPTVREVTGIGLVVAGILLLLLLR
ncbi:MAG TPA: DMT family transporter [Pseudomonadales bacterium]|nr:DMT family transporter [Pseudomonadales bacterium]